jgi:hypothetical protein
MSAYDDSDYFSTDDQALQERRASTHQAARAVAQASTRVGLAILTSGMAVASALLFNSPTCGRYANAVLWAAGVFAAWFCVSVFASNLRNR